MDFGDLQDAIEETSYVPTAANRAPRTANKSLTKNSSVKSIENVVPAPSPPPPPKTNLLQIHRQTRKEAMSFQDLIRNQSQPPPPSPIVQEKRPQAKEVRFDSSKQAKKAPPVKDNYWNDEEDDAPAAVVPNRMKPPLIRRGDDNRSVASRRNEDNRSVASNAQLKRKEQEPFNNFSAPQPNFSISLTPPVPNPLEQTRQIKRQPIYQAYTEPKQINVVADTSQLKKMLEEQLQLQRQFTEKIMKQEQESHKKEVEKLKELHAEELTRKLELKSLEIQKLKEFYDMQLRARGQRADELRELQSVSRKVEEGVRALGKAEEGLRSKGAQFEQNLQSKVNQNKVFSDFANQKQSHVQQLFSKLEAREKQFREERQRGLTELDRQRRKLEQNESKLYKRQRELQEKYSKKQRVLVEEYDDKRRKLNQEQSQLRLKRMEVEQERLCVQQEREQAHQRQRKADESRSKLMEELQAERIKLSTRELEISSKSHEWQAKESELLMKEREVAGRFKLIELERKRVDVEREMKRKTGHETRVGFSFDKGEIGPSPLEKSIKQLKDEYLRNLGHI